MPGARKPSGMVWLLPRRDPQRCAGDLGRSGGSAPVGRSRPPSRADRCRCSRPSPSSSVDSPKSTVASSSVGSTAAMGASRATSTTSTSSAVERDGLGVRRVSIGSDLRSYDPGRSRSAYVPSASVWVDRPLSSAATTAPAIGWPSLASVTVPWTRPVGTAREAVGAVGVEEILEEAELQGIGAVGVLDADAGVPAVARVGGVRP